MCAASPASVQRHCAAAASCTCRPQHVSTSVVELTHKGRLRHTVQLRGGRGTRHWQCNASALLGTCPPKASVHQQRRPARREFRPRTVAIATLGHHEPAHGLPDRPQRVVGSGLRWSSLVGRVLAPAGVNSPDVLGIPTYKHNHRPQILRCMPQKADRSGRNTTGAGLAMLTWMSTLLTHMLI